MFPTTSAIFLCLSAPFGSPGAAYQSTEVKTSSCCEPPWSIGKPPVDAPICSKIVAMGPPNHVFAVYEQRYYHLCPQPLPDKNISVRKIGDAIRSFFSFGGDALVGWRPQVHIRWIQHVPSQMGHHPWRFIAGFFQSNGFAEVSVKSIKISVNFSGCLHVFYCSLPQKH